MFGKRAITITWNKKTETGTPDNPEEETFEERTELIMAQIKDLGFKMFMGICAYVALDTYRQIAVAKATNKKPNQP